MFGSTRRFQIGVNNLHICPTDEHQLEAEDGQVPGDGAPCDDRLVQPHEGVCLQRTDGGVRSLLQRGHVRAPVRGPERRGEHLAVAREAGPFTSEWLSVCRLTSAYTRAHLKVDIV
jgi:hypothetical protein